MNKKLSFEDIFAILKKINQNYIDHINSEGFANFDNKDFFSEDKLSFMAKYDFIIADCYNKTDVIKCSSKKFSNKYSYIKLLKFNDIEKKVISAFNKNGKLKLDFDKIIDHWIEIFAKDMYCNIGHSVLSDFLKYICSDSGIEKFSHHIIQNDFKLLKEYFLGILRKFVLNLEKKAYISSKKEKKSFSPQRNFTEKQNLEKEDTIFYFFYMVKKALINSLPYEHQLFFELRESKYRTLKELIDLCNKSKYSSLPLMDEKRILHVANQMGVDPMKPDINIEDIIDDISYLNNPANFKSNVRIFKNKYFKTVNKLYFFIIFIFLKKLLVSGNFDDTIFNGIIKFISEEAEIHGDVFNEFINNKEMYSAVYKMSDLQYEKFIDATKKFISSNKWRNTLFFIIYQWVSSKRILHFEDFEFQLDKYKNVSSENLEKAKQVNNNLFNEFLKMSFSDYDKKKFTNDEIAKLLGLKIDNFKKKIKEIRKAIKDYLKKTVATEKDNEIVNILYKMISEMKETDFDEELC